MSWAFLTSGGYPPVGRGSPLVITRSRKTWLAPHREPRINEPRKQDQFFTALPIFEKQSDSRISFTAGVSRSIARLLAASNRYVSSGDPSAIHSALRPSRAPCACGFRNGHGRRRDKENIELDGTPGRIRTCDLLLRRRPPLSHSIHYPFSSHTVPRFRGICFRSKLIPFPPN